MKLNSERSLEEIKSDDNKQNSLIDKKEECKKVNQEHIEGFWDLIPQSDAVIVLGHNIKEGPSKKIRPSLEGKMRTLGGYEIYKRGKTKNIILSSGHCLKEFPDISLAQVMKDYLLDRKVPAENLLTEDVSKNTAENLRESLKILKEKDWHKVIIITNEYHLERARQLFENILRNEDFKVEFKTISCEDILNERSPHYQKLLSYYQFPSSLKKVPKTAIIKGTRELLRRIIIFLDKDDKIARFLAHQFRNKEE